MRDPQTRPRFPYAWWAFAVLWFAGWHLMHTWQVWLDPTMRVPGPIGDNTVMLWNLGWVRHALNHGHPGFWFANAYYPDGFLFLYGTHTWLDGFLGWLFSPVLPGGIAASILWANITMALATVVSGLAVIGALRAWGIRQWPILILVASMVVFSWFRMFALQGHYHFYGTQWMLLCLAFVSASRRAFLDRHRPKAINLMICAGLTLGLTFLNDQTMAVFAGILGGLVIISGATSAGDNRLKNLVLPFFIFYGLSLIPASVHLIPLVVSLADNSLNYNVSLDTPRLVDATSLIIPPEISWLGFQISGLREGYGFTWAEGTYLGIVPISLLLVITFGAIRYILKKPGERPQYLRVSFYSALLAWLFILLAMGDTLMLGRDQFNAMPGRLLRQIPVLNNIRLPQRWVWPAHLCIALGGASVLALAIQAKKQSWLRWLPLAIAVIPALEAIRYPAVAPVDYRNDAFLRPPGLIEAVQKHYTGGGVLVMPPEIAYAHSNVFQFQWGYDIPVTVAYTARMPFKIQELPWKGRVWTLETAEWLQKKDVTMIVFAFHDGKVLEYQSWLTEARKAVPGVIVLNRFGEAI